MIPNEGSFAELDSKVKDKWGIPVMKWHWKWSDHELNMAAHAQKTFAGIFEMAGGKGLYDPKRDPRKAILNGGEVIHEVGGALMGSDAKKSVCNRWNQTWDIKNLLLCDGSPFASNADKNPTETIMALAWRAADRLIAEARKGNL
jgi:choline dehydrogenase-like flavoprotein